MTLQGSPEHSNAPEEYFAVPPLMVFPRAHGRFEVYLKQNGRYVLYTRAEEGFTEKQRQRLFEHGVQEVHIPVTQREGYLDYVEQNLGGILSDESKPLEVRASVFQDASKSIVKEIFENRLPSQLDEQNYRRINSLVDSTLFFLGQEGSFKQIARLISHDYRTYNHSVQVMLYALAVLDGCGLDQEQMHQAGVGAALHDMGKLRVPKRILNKKGSLTAEEWNIIERHPALGVALCSRVKLSSTTLNCIMFHHEKENGQGYPTGINGDDIPIPVKAVSLADAYDALTSHRSYARAVSPFEALRVMKDEMTGSFDPDMYRRLIKVLSGAGVMES